MNIVTDLRYALRSLGRSKTFTFTAVVTLAIAGLQDLGMYLDLSLAGPQSPGGLERGEHVPAILHVIGGGVELK